MARKGTGITTRHCKCKKVCVSNGKRVCKKTCGHPNRYQVRKQMPDGSRPSKWFTNYPAQRASGLQSSGWAWR